MDGNEPAYPAVPARAEVLARLTEQMREIATAPVSGRPPGSGTSGRARGHAVSAATEASASPKADAPGHPDDDLGDPEAVAKAICLRLLTGAARPRAGLAAALHRKGIPDDVAERVLDRLTEVGLIDDEAYAQSFVASRHRHGGLGANALRQELARKGVDAQTAASVVAVVDRDAEYQRARALLERRVDSAMVNGADTARRRLLGLLARRGYPSDLAQRVVQEVLDQYDTQVDATWS